MLDDSKVLSLGFELLVGVDARTAERVDLHLLSLHLLSKLARGLGEKLAC